MWEHSDPGNGNLCNCIMPYNESCSIGRSVIGKVVGLGFFCA